MTVIQYILHSKKDNEILRMYRELEQQGNLDKAFQLRAAYIRKQTLNVDKIEWSEVLQAFVFEEAMYLLNMSLTEAITMGENPLAYQINNLQISRYSSFLMAEMINQNLFEAEDFNPKDILFKEILLLSSRFLAEQISVYLFDILSGADTQEALETALTYTNRFLSPIIGIKSSIQKGEPIDNHLEALEVTAEVCLEGEVSQVLLQNTQNTYSFLFAYFLDKGDYEQSETYRKKALAILNKEDFMWDIVNLFGKITKR